MTEIILGAVVTGISIAVLVVMRLMASSLIFYLTEEAKRANERELNRQFNEIQLERRLKVLEEQLDNSQPTNSLNWMDLTYEHYNIRGGDVRCCVNPRSIEEMM